MTSSPPSLGPLSRGRRLWHRICVTLSIPCHFGAFVFLDGGWGEKGATLAGVYISIYAVISALLLLYGLIFRGPLLWPHFRMVYMMLFGLNAMLVLMMYAGIVFYGVSVPMFDYIGDDYFGAMVLLLFGASGSLASGLNRPKYYMPSS